MLTIRLDLLGIAILAVVVGTCSNEGGGSAIRYEVAVQFNTSFTQDDLSEAEAILRSYDEALDYLIQESFPPTGRALLTTDAPDFCSTIEAELKAKTYVQNVVCKEWREPSRSLDPEKPVTSTD